MITAAQVRDWFDYDRETGVLYWRKGKGRARPGAVAGSIRTDKLGPTWRIRLNNKFISRARVVWAWHHGEFPNDYVLHLNRNNLDDRIENLAINSRN